SVIRQDRAEWIWAAFDYGKDRTVGALQHVYGIIRLSDKRYGKHGWTKGENVGCRQRQYSHCRPLGPPLPTVDDPHAEPDAEGCERGSSGQHGHGHAAIVPAVAWGREGEYGTAVGRFRIGLP